MVHARVHRLTDGALHASCLNIIQSTIDQLVRSEAGRFGGVGPGMVAGATKQSILLDSKCGTELVCCSTDCGGLADDCGR